MTWVAQVDECDKGGRGELVNMRMDTEELLIGVSRAWSSGQH